jgi:hypothetical protein
VPCAQQISSNTNTFRYVCYTEYSSNLIVRTASATPWSACLLPTTCRQPVRLLKEQHLVSYVQLRRNCNNCPVVHLPHAILCRCSRVTKQPISHNVTAWQRVVMYLLFRQPDGLDVTDQESHLAEQLQRTEGTLFQLLVVSVAQLLQRRHGPRLDDERTMFGHRPCDSLQRPHSLLLHLGGLHSR